MSAPPKAPLKPGEKGFTLILLAVALFCLAQALLLWREKPGLAGPAGVPILSAALVSALLTAAVIRNIKAPSETPRTLPVRERLMRALRYAVSRDVLYAFAALALYGALLAAGASFYLVTPLFLYGLTTVFSRGNYLKNLLPAALCTAFVYVVFELLFHVQLP